MMELFLVVRRKGNLHEVHLGRFRMDMRNEKRHSKCSSVVQEVTHGVFGSAPGFQFEGTAIEGEETTVKIRKCRSES